MFHHHSIIPWGSFRGRQEEKWGSFRGWHHFGVNLGIISELGIISGAVQNPSRRLPFCRENEWRNLDRLILNDRHLRKTALDPRSNILLFALRVNQF